VNEFYNGDILKTYFCNVVDRRVADGLATVNVNTVTNFKQTFIFPNVLLKLHH